jgi:hypothetical protein
MKWFKIVLVMLLTCTALSAFEVTLEWRTKTDTLKIQNQEYRAYYNRMYKILISFKGFTKVRVPTHQYRPAGKYAIIEAPNNPIMRTAGMRRFWVKFHVVDGAIEIIHTDMRYRYYDFDEDTAQTVIGTTEAFGTAGQWEVVRRAIRDKVNEVRVKQGKPTFE